MNEKQKWHFFNSNGFSYLVIGYNPQNDNVACICIDDFHKQDQKDLECLASSSNAQKTPYLVEILARSPYLGGSSWLKNLYHHIFFLKLEKLYNHISDEQIEIFKKERYWMQKYVNPMLYHKGSLNDSSLIDDVLYGRVRNI
jgi:hypothetical protein